MLSNLETSVKNYVQLMTFDLVCDNQERFQQFGL